MNFKTEVGSASITTGNDKGAGGLSNGIGNFLGLLIGVVAIHEQSLSRKKGNPALKKFKLNPTTVMVVLLGLSVTVAGSVLQAKVSPLHINNASFTRS